MLSLLVLCRVCFGQFAFTDSDPKLPAGAYNPADYDGDGWVDVMVMVNTGTNYYAALSRNTNGTVFTTTPLPQTATSRPGIIWRDENGDGLLDFAIACTNSSGAVTLHIFRQGADHTFTSEDTGIAGNPVHWIDLDNDGRNDFLIQTSNTGTNQLTIFWRGLDGAYAETTVIPAGISVSATVADLDGDGDNDIIYYAPSTYPYTTTTLRRVFRNDGARHFVDAGVAPSSQFLADFNGDGRLDFFGTTQTSSPTIPTTTTTANRVISFGQGGLLFNSQTVATSTSDWTVLSVADFDGDGSPDWLTFTGYNVSGAPPYLTLNLKGAYVRSDVTFSASAYDVSAITVADFDGDGDLDFLATPRSAGPTRLLRSSLNPNTLVAAPGNLVSLVRRDRVDFSWGGSTATSYNVRVGTTPGGNDVLASMSRPDGRRQLPRMGNVGPNHLWHLSNLKPGTYFWSVQAVDYGFRGSPFAAEQSFTVGEPGALPTAPTIESIETQAIDEDTPVELAVQVGPSDVADSLVLEAESSNATLIPPAQITFSGTGVNRTMRIVPGADQSGIASVTVRAIDFFGQVATNRFYITVFPVNDPPIISEIPNQLVYLGDQTLTIPFDVNDVDTPLPPTRIPPFPGDTTGFKVTASSSDTNIVPNSSIIVTNTASGFPKRTLGGYYLSLTQFLQIGSSTITLSTTDGTNSSTRSFVVTVEPPLFRDSGTRILTDVSGATPVFAADFNNDGRMDLLAGAGTSSMFLNTTNGFVRTQTGFQTSGMVALGDFNRDNFVDIFAVATDSVHIYMNQGGTNFNATIVSFINPFQYGHVEAVDIDNDGDLDIVISGTLPDTGVSAMRVFLNDNGKFTATASPFSTYAVNFALADLDQDGWLDFVFSGTTTTGAQTNGIMRGIGGGRFAFQAGSNLTTPISFQQFADVDGDGVLDLQNGNQFYHYANGAFSLAGAYTAPTGFPTLVTSRDLDNDGRTDFIYQSAYSPGATMKFQLMLNDGNYQLSSIGNPFVGAGLGSRFFADLNGDGTTDLVGTTTNGLVILTNAFARPNPQPGVPRNLRAERVGDALRFSWDAPTDLNQSAGFTYNVRVGSAPGLGDIVSPLSLANGRRLVQVAGNTGYRASLLLTNLTKAKYYWTVQAVDADFAGSAFAPEQSIGYSLPGNLPPTVTISPSEYVGPEDATIVVTLQISDDTTAATNVTLRVFAADPTFLGPTNITVTGTNATRTVTIKPPANMAGQTELIIRATDLAGATSTNRMSITVTNVNDAPTISYIFGRLSYGPADPVTFAFTINDVDDAPDTLTLSVSSDHPDLLPPDSFVFGGSGTNRTLKITAATESSETAIVTLRVSDPAGATRAAVFPIYFAIVSGGQFDAAWTATGLQINLTGDAEREYVIESSTDLKTWSELETVSTATGQIPVAPHFSPLEGAMFYRARVK